VDHFQVVKWPGKTGQRASNCIFYTILSDHFWHDLHKVITIVMSFLVAAAMMTLCGFPAARNLLDRNFTADAPNQKWAGDISYV
jgi:transposase InsO family protein